MKITYFIERESELKFIENLMLASIETDQVRLVHREKLSAKTEEKLKNRSIETTHLRSLIKATFFFCLLDDQLLISTVAGLGTSYFRKSFMKNCQYFHIPHSLISLDSGYAEGAFDQFDGFLLAAPYQYDEIRRIEKLRQTTRKQVLVYGYEPIESLRKYRRKESVNKKIIIAPSWNGPLSNFDSLLALFTSLHDFSGEIVFRPHDLMWRQINLTQRKKLEGYSKKIKLSLTNAIDQDLIDSDLMITDFSGVAFEFALGLQRPVLFYDEGSKGNSLTIGVESSLRSHFGDLFKKEDLPDLLPKIQRLMTTWNSPSLDNLFYPSELNRKYVLRKFREGQWPN